jgi:hypothetical protein
MDYSFSKFHQSFSRMADTDTDARAREVARSGMHGSVGVAPSSVYWAHETKRRGGGGRGAVEGAWSDVV